MNKLIVKRKPFPGSLSPFRLNSFPTLFPSDLFYEFDALLEKCFDFNTEYANLSLRKGFPKGDVFIEDGKVKIELALAGYSKEQLSVRVEDNNLIISGDKNIDTKDSSKGRSLKRSSFTRTFSNFTNEWNIEKANVIYKDGLLVITVPASEQEVKAVTELKIK